MKNILLFLLSAVILTGCSGTLNGVIVGKDISSYDVDVKMDNGNVRSVELTPEQFYSGDFETGKSIEFYCIVQRCFPE